MTRRGARLQKDLPVAVAVHEALPVAPRLAEAQMLSVQQAVRALPPHVRLEAQRRGVVEPKHLWGRRGAARRGAARSASGSSWRSGAQSALQTAHAEMQCAQCTGCNSGILRPGAPLRPRSAPLGSAEASRAIRGFGSGGASAAAAQQGGGSAWEAGTGGELQAGTIQGSE